MRILAVFITLLLLTAIPASLFSLPYGTLQTDEVIVRFEEPLRPSAGEILDVYPSVKEELIRRLGIDLDFRPEVILVKGGEQFRRMAENSRVVAFAAPSQNLIVIDHSKMHVHPFTLAVTLKHELCHLQLHRYVGEGELPRWLDEGLCQWVTGGVAEIMDHGTPSDLRKAVLAKRIIGIDALKERFPEKGEAFSLAYEESKSIVEYLVKEYGITGVLDIMRYLRDGSDIDSAVEKGLTISLSELEERWKAHLAERASWLAYFSEYLYELLFLAAALITIYGFIRVIQKKREYRDDEEDPELPGS